tara:strand:+ start:964 stop:1095 length:132 start_codon:yes stop_codon:yes gene_type:complete
MNEAAVVAVGITQMQLGPVGLEVELVAASHLLMARHPGHNRFG